MLQFFKCGQTKEHKYFVDNGGALLEELIASFNGRHEIPFRCFTAKELIRATKNFAEMSPPYGYIYRGSTNGHQILVRWLKYHGFNAIRDIAITSQMSHLKNVLKLSGCCLEFKNPALVCEFVEFEPLSNLYEQGRYNDNLFSWKNRVQIATGIANTILYLHTAFQTPIIYRDLCPSNMILDQHGVAKLFNFSLSISLPHGESRVEDGIRGTYGYIDPEYFESRFVTPKTDVYGIGLLLLVLVTGQEAQCKDSDGETIHIVDYVNGCIEKDQWSQIIDPRIFKEGFDDQHQQLRAMLDLGTRCTRPRGMDRPEMIDVAKELRQIEKCINC